VPEFIATKKKRFQFHIVADVQNIEKLVQSLPGDQVYKFISDGGFSSIGFIKFVADRVRIETLHAATLRVGKKHLAVLDNLKKQGKLNRCIFAVGNLMKDDSERGKSYGYYDDLKRVCELNDWEIIVANNHAKILLFDTENGRYVLETSSNLNENPKIEQFSFEKNEELYSFYLKFFERLRNEASG
jgi:hypothetical protein